MGLLVVLPINTNKKSGEFYLFFSKNMQQVTKYSKYENQNI
jgi:hypothetical protein